jgi:hypothetical protein
MSKRDQEPLKDWEKSIHEKLDALSEMEAPSTLIPGVMSRIRASETAPWYRAAWWQWPLALRIASVLLVLGVLGMLAWLSGTFGELGPGRQLLRVCLDLKAGLGLALDRGGAALGASTLFWREHGQIILLAAAALLMATYLTCVAAGTALYQLAWKRTL